MIHSAGQFQRLKGIKRPKRYQNWTEIQILIHVKLTIKLTTSGDRNSQIRNSNQEKKMRLEK